MQTFGLKDEYIKLGQLLKATGLVGSGVDAKIVVQEGLVKVNGKVCYMRGIKEIFLGIEGSVLFRCQTDIGAVRLLLSCFDIGAEHRDEHFLYAGS